MTLNKLSHALLALLAAAALPIAAQAQTPSPTVTPNGPYVAGINGIVVQGSGPASSVAAIIAADSGLRVETLWMLAGTWLFYLPDAPSIDGGLTQFSGPVAAAVAVLSGAPTPAPPLPPAPSPSPAPPPPVTPTPPSESCDPAYPGVCVPPPPPDLDCGDIPERGFTVLPPDPHGFDGDGDGVGCEG